VEIWTNDNHSLTNVAGYQYCPYSDKWRPFCGGREDIAAGIFFGLVKIQYLS
jgi:hypothetical protein